MREEINQTLKVACEEVNLKPAVSADNKEIEALRAENAKLKYRIGHLKRALDEKD